MSLSFTVTLSVWNLMIIGPDAYAVTRKHQLLTVSTSIFQLYASIPRQLVVPYRNGFKYFRFRFFRFSAERLRRTLFPVVSPRHYYTVFVLFKHGAFRFIFFKRLQRVFRSCTRRSSLPYESENINIQHLNNICKS